VLIRVKKILLCFCLLLITITGPAYAVRAQGEDFPRTVFDATGSAVTIPARPALIATSGSDPILTLLLPPERVRRVTPTAADWAGVGLLVIPGGTAAAYPALIESAEAAGIPVYRTALIDSLASWREAVRQLGHATGSDDQAARLIARLDHRLAAIQTKLSGGPPARVLILTPEGYTFGQGTLITELVEAAGGINTAAGYGDFRQIDDHAIRTLAPDVILLSPAWPDPDRFVSNPAYASVPAVRSGRVYRLPFSPTAPPDPAAAVLGLALLLHPAVLLFS
jgi:ABC-type Fe3+-hydroxamate transport system substrate-binding protein